MKKDLAVIRIMIIEDEGIFRDMFNISLSAVPNLEIVDAVSAGSLPLPVPAACIPMQS